MKRRRDLHCRNELALSFQQCNPSVSAHTQVCEQKEKGKKHRGERMEIDSCSTASHSAQ